MKSVSKKMAAVALSLALLVPTTAAYAAETTLTLEQTAAIKAASELRATLTELLGEHALLDVLGPQKSYDNAPDFEEIAGRIKNNTEQLTLAIASVYGADRGEAFKTLWSSHIDYVVEYVVATKANSETGRTAAKDKLDVYAREQAKFFADLNPNLSVSELETHLKTHVQDLLGAFDAYVNKDYPAAYAGLTATYNHAIDLAKTLSEGIAAQYPDKYKPSIITAARSELQGELGRLLGLHAFEAVLAMQKGIDGKADFDNVAALLAQNTSDLSKAIASVYGEAAAAAFTPIWTSHITYLVDYVKATAAKDENAKKAAVAKLDSYRVEQAKFFADANKYFVQADIEAGLKKHIDHLLTVFDHYVQKDYTFTYANTDMAYEHMFDTAMALTEGISQQYPEQFPTEPVMVDRSRAIMLKIGDNKLMTSGMTVEMDVTPVLKDNIVYVPIRFVAETAGAKVTWETPERIAWAENGVVKASFAINSNEVTVNGESKQVLAATYLQGDRTVVPASVFADVFNWVFEYNSADGSITLIPKLMNGGATPMTMLP